MENMVSCWIYHPAVLSKYPAAKVFAVANTNNQRAAFRSLPGYTLLPAAAPFKDYQYVYVFSKNVYNKTQLIQFENNHRFHLPLIIFFSSVRE